MGAEKTDFDGDKNIFRRPLRLFWQSDDVADEEADLETLIVRHLRTKRTNACTEWIRQACIDRFVVEQLAKAVSGGEVMPAVKELVEERSSGGEII